MKKNYILFSLLLAVLLLAACSKADEYKQYTTNGETLYTGKLDSAIVYAGRLRVKINGLLPADPKITKTKITWNSGVDSVVFNITKGNGVEPFSQIVAVQEGIQNFVIQNFDAVGNGSIKVNTTGTAYGPRYEATLNNRPIVSAELQPNGNTIITWDSFDTTSGAKGTWIRFTRTTNAIDSVYIPVSQNVTTIPGLKLGTPIVLRTRYLPAPNMIDTFYAAPTTRSVKADVTSIYLSNTGPNFARAAFDGRWGTLAAPWMTNAAAKNKGGGMYGGYASDIGGVINWETWNNTPVINGILYQATSAPLPAGSYTVSFDEYSEIQSNSTVYCVAAVGNGGIPVLANLNTALGYVGLYNGATPGTTGPSATDTRSFTFTLTTPQVVSIGFLGNVAGGNNVGSYFQVKRIQLFSN